MRHNLLLRCLVCVLGAALPLPAANRFLIENQTVPEGGTGIGVYLMGDLDQTIYGFSFGVNYDEAVLTVTEVTIEGTVILPTAFTDGDGGFFDGIQGILLAAGGILLVFVMGPPVIQAITARRGS